MSMRVTNVDEGDDAREESADIDSLFDDDEDEKDDDSTNDHIDIVIQSFRISDVKAFDKVRFNTNNHWNYRVNPENHLRLQKVEEATRPVDYDEAAANVETRHWIDSFHSHYRVVNIPPSQIPWMKRSSGVACSRAGKISALFADELEETVRETPTGDTFEKCDTGVPTSGYFVRTETVSLKGGVHGVGPYFDLATMVESAVTAYGGHQAVTEDTEKLKFYLLPWLPDLNKLREFRVFVRRGRVTAISQQSLYRVNDILEGLTDEQKQTVIHNWCKLLVTFVNDIVVPRLARCLPQATRVPSEFDDLKSLDDHQTDAVPKQTSNELCTTAAYSKVNKSGGSDSGVSGGSDSGVSGGGGVSVVMDVALLGAEAPRTDLEDGTTALTPYFIEVNPFGFAYSSGSSLFSWVDDYAVLYGLCPESKDKVHFRYTSA